MIESNKLHYECTKLVNTRHNKKIVYEVCAYFKKKDNEKKVDDVIPEWLRCFCCLSY